MEPLCLFQNKTCAKLRGEMNRIYKSSVVKLYQVMIALLVLTTNISSASHDPWGENLQPKLHTDYLNEYSGKKILSINIT